MLTGFKKTIGIILIAAAAGFAGANFHGKPADNNVSISSRNAQAPIHLVNYNGITTTSPGGYPDFTEAAEATVHDVVYIKTTYDNKSAGNQLQWDPWNGFFSAPSQQPQAAEASGSGVIVTADGYIVTNNHVVDNASKVEVTLDDHRSYIAKVVGTDPSTDLAVIKIDEKGLPFIRYGNSDDLKVGQWVLAVGNPFNLTSTVTAGIVSAKARNIGALEENSKTAIESYIQTDAAINPGNSGGALVNTSGELVGINSAIASNTGSYTGYSFAIPVNIVKKVVDDLVEYGKVERGYLGVQIQDIDSKLAQEKNIKDYNGVYVAGIVEGGAANSAGIHEGDVIKKIGDEDVSSAPALQEQVSKFRPGDKINVTVDRNGQEKLYAVTLKDMEGGVAIVKANSSFTMLGAEFATVSKNEADKLGIDGGVKINKLEAGKLRAAGIQEGFIITTIDKKPVKDTDDLNAALKNKSGGVLIEGVYPNGMRAYYGFGI
jgi:Do/DeqQ family serine protease